MYSSDIDSFLFAGQVVRSSAASRRAGTLLGANGVPAGSVVVIVDGVVHERGLTKNLEAGLAEAGYQAQIFADINGEPDLETVERAAALASRIAATAFLGLGGGSALDTAKLVAYHSVSGTPLAELRGPAPRLAGFPPLVLIPTTVGTGAEATRVAMFAVDGVKRAVLSPQFVPDIAILDSDLVADLPIRVVAGTALDALSHALESMLSTSANDLTWMFSAEAARRILEWLPRAQDGDADARAELLYASFLAGVGLNAGVVLGHSMSYVLAARHQLVHGEGCALALPYCLAYDQGAPAGRGRQVAAAVLGRPDSSLWDLADAVRRLTAHVGLATDLAGLGGDSTEVTSLAESIVRDYPRPTNPVPITAQRLTTLLKFLHTGDLLGAWAAMGEA